MKAKCSRYYSFLGVVKDDENEATKSRTHFIMACATLIWNGSDDLNFASRSW